MYDLYLYMPLGQIRLIIISFISLVSRLRQKTTKSSLFFFFKRNEPAPKKSKSGGSGAKRLKNDDGETYFELERTRRVSVREFRNKLMVDIREYYEKDGKYLPGKKGGAHLSTHWPF